MFVEQRTYTLQVGGHVQWYENYQKYGMEAQKEILGHMVGYFHTDIGPLNQIVHMWAYDDLKERSERRAKLAADPRWQEMMPKNRPLIVDMESKILIPAPFSPIP